jgi:hypothetical protein
MLRTDGSQIIIFAIACTALVVSVSTQPDTTIIQPNQWPYVAETCSFFARNHCCGQKPNRARAAVSPARPSDDPYYYLSHRGNPFLRSAGRNFYGNRDDYYSGRRTRAGRQTNNDRKENWHPDMPGGWDGDHDSDVPNDGSRASWRQSEEVEPSPTTNTTNPTTNTTNPTTNTTHPTTSTTTPGPRLPEEDLLGRRLKLVFKCIRLILLSYQAGILHIPRECCENGIRLFDGYFCNDGIPLVSP